MAFPAFVILVVIAVIWTLAKLPTESDLGTDAASRKELRQFLVLDIRAANHYCLALIALLGVMSVIAANNHVALTPMLDRLQIWPFGLAFGAAGLSVLFVPAGFGAPGFKVLRVLWVRTVLCEQVAVLCTLYGVYCLLAVIFG